MWKQIDKTLKAGTLTNVVKKFISNGKRKQKKTREQTSI